MNMLIIFVYNRHVVKRFSVLSYNTPVESLDCAAATSAEVVPSNTAASCKLRTRLTAARHAPYSTAQYRSGH